jgi:hypothetical protein
MWSVWLSITGANVAVCIAVGMLNIHIMDDAIVREAEHAYGKTITHTGNFLIHFFPVLVWEIFLFSGIWLARYRILPKDSSAVTVAFLVYPALLSMLFLLTYAVCFRASREYVGDLDFEVMSAWIVIALVFSNAWHSAIYQSHVEAIRRD